MMLFMSLGAGLPNLHPALVHFPLALLPVAVALDLATLLLRRPTWLDRAAPVLYAMGALGAGAAFLAGEEAEEGLRGLQPAVASLIDEHSDWATRTLWIFVVVAVLRIGIFWYERRSSRGGPRALRYVVLLAAGAGLWLLAETADHGGALVYRHGVAVQPAGAAGPSEAPP
jgi:uncharacterized membrane protein